MLMRMRMRMVEVLSDFKRYMYNTAVRNWCIYEILMTG